MLFSIYSMICISSLILLRIISIFFSKIKQMKEHKCNKHIFAHIVCMLLTCMSGRAWGSGYHCHSIESYLHSNPKFPCLHSNQREYIDNTLCSNSKFPNICQTPQWQHVGLIPYTVVFLWIPVGIYSSAFARSMQALGQHGQYRVLSGHD